MRQDKEYIFKLRKEGKSYRDIQTLTGVSRATLSSWFKNMSWSKHISEEHTRKLLGATKERMFRMNMARKLTLQWKYALAEKDALKEYEKNRKEPLFWAGLMIYAGEGDKRTKHQIRISNTEFFIHRIFIDFVTKYLGVEKDRFRIGLLLYPDLDDAISKDKWSIELGISSNNFYKTHVIKGREPVKRLQYGIGMSIITNTELKKKLLKWISLAEKEKFNFEAVMV